MALSHAAVLCPSDDAKTAEKEETAARNKKTENTGDNGVDAAEDGEVAGEDARTTRGDENDRDDGKWQILSDFVSGALYIPMFQGKSNALKSSLSFNLIFLPASKISAFIWDISSRFLIFFILMDKRAALNIQLFFLLDIPSFKDKIMTCRVFASSHVG